MELLTRNSLIAIVGAGAVGGYYGARLAQAGHDVHFLLRSDYAAVAANGWVVQSCDGDFRLPPGATRVYDDPASMPPADLVIVTLKATANDRYAELIGPLLKPGTAILTLQNGLGNEERLAGLFGAGRVLGGLAFVCINRIGPGVVHHMDHGLIRLGEFGGGRSPRAESIAAALRGAKVRCEVLDSLLYGRWQKLVWNVPFNGLGAALDLTTDLLINNEAGTRLVTAIMREVIAAARAVGAALPDDLIQFNLDQTRTMDAYLTSMQIDRQAGREMEVEAILGAPVRAAEAAGVAVPNMRMVYELVAAVNLGKMNGG